MARRTKTEGMGFGSLPSSASDPYPVRSVRKGARAAEKHAYGRTSNPDDDVVAQADDPYAKPTVRERKQPKLPDLSDDDIEQALEDNKTEGVSMEAFDIDFTGNPAIDLAWLAEQDNLAPYLTDNARRQFGEDLWRLHENNLASIDEWKADAEKGIEAADQKLAGGDDGSERENDLTGEDAPPRFPLITHAGVEFSAKAFEALFSDPLIVKVEDPTPAGEDNDPTRQQVAEDLSYFLSYQTQVLDEGWVDGTDDLLHHMSLTGMAWRKRWYDPRAKQFKSEWFKGWDVIVNNKCSNINREPLLSQPFMLYPHEVRQNIASGYFYDVDMRGQTASGDWFKPVEFLECHAWLDWDNDGIDEPWIITVQVETKNVVRAIPAWQPHGILVDGHGITFDRECYFTPYRFVPSADGTFYAKGFGHLLGQLGTTIDEILSEIVRAAKLNNSNGGVIGRIGNGMPESIVLRPNELQVIPVDGQELNKSIVWFPTKEVPQTLFSVLGLLTQAGEKLASSVDLMPDGTPANMPATTAMAIVQQGSRIYSSILRRVWRAMSREFQQLYDLNKRYSDDELPFDFLGKKGVIAAELFQRTRNVQVAADPQMSSDMHRATMMELYSKFLNDPMTDPLEIRKRIWRLSRVPAPDALVKPPQGPPPEIQIKMIEAQARMMEVQSKEAERQDAAKHQATIALKDLVESMVKLQSLMAGTPAEAPGAEGQPGKPAVPGADLNVLAMATAQLYQQLSALVKQDAPNGQPQPNAQPQSGPSSGPVPSAGGARPPGPVPPANPIGNGPSGLGPGPSNGSVPSTSGNAPSTTGGQMVNG